MFRGLRVCSNASSHTEIFGLLMTKFWNLAHISARFSGGKNELTMLIAFSFNPPAIPPTESSSCDIASVPDCVSYERLKGDLPGMKLLLFEESTRRGWKRQNQHTRRGVIGTMYTRVVQCVSMVRRTTDVAHEHWESRLPPTKSALLCHFSNPRRVVTADLQA